MGNRCEMTDDEIFAENVWDKIQQHEYIVVGGNVIELGSGEVICLYSDLFK